MIQIDNADDLEDVNAVRELLREYQSALGIDLSFQAFDAEVVALPGEYRPPCGRLLLARSDGAVAGCVAMRPLRDDTREMKRLYVRPQHRAGGVGRRLVERVIAEARTMEYRHLYLDTLPLMGRAQALYSQLGFRDIPAYRHDPIAGTRYLGLDL